MTGKEGKGSAPGRADFAHSQPEARILDDSYNLWIDPGSAECGLAPADGPSLWSSKALRTTIHLP